MQLELRAMSAFLLQVFVLIGVVNCIFGSRFDEIDDYADPYVKKSRHFGKGVKEALEQLQHNPCPELVPNWPNPEVKLGQVSGVAIDSAGRVLVFHRGPNVWEADTFTMRNVYSYIGSPPIQEPTVLIFNDSGNLVDKWGEKMFYMPHGITVDNSDNVWMTDVALHQVFKFAADDLSQPAMVLGEKFVPGADATHFCKPTAVAVTLHGEFFVADGYCNSRIIKFAPDGTRILQWGREQGDSPYSLAIPHALTLAEDKNLLCAADREHGRVSCFRADNGTFVVNFKNEWVIGPRVFSVAYTPLHGGRLYVVNGPSGEPYPRWPVRGYVIDLEEGKLIATFAPKGDFSNPHDIAVTRDSMKVYVVELNPFRVLRFDDPTFRNMTESRRGGVDVSSILRPYHAKPTATLEVSSNAMATEGGWVSWRGAAGGALGAAAGALIVLAALALFSARTRGRKSVPRRRWEYGGSAGEFKLRRLLQRRRFTRVQSDDSEDEPAPMLPVTTQNHAAA